MVDWEDIRHFLAVAQSKSLAGAARALDVDRATVGRRLAALEATLDVRLVDRPSRSCRLTPVGAQVYKWAVDMEANAHGIADVVKAARTPIIGRVTLSAPPILAAHVFAAHMPRFRSEHPHIEISLSAHDAQSQPRKSETDLAVRLVPPDERDGTARTIGTMTFGLYAHRDYAHLDVPERWQFIAFDQRYADLPLQRWLLGVAGDRPVVSELNRISEHLIAARAGIGIAGLPCFIADRDRDLVRIYDDVPSFARDLCLVKRRDLRKTQAVRAVMDFIADVVAGNPDLAPGSPLSQYDDRLEQPARRAVG
ncbi:LysR family transcriptional regulator [Nitratireductor pacificus]|uniref:LysR family transcriptional regulator n=1 Tax=Nitratireductor pacificus pht-3B TaxID=391937 RepID=K2MZ93_9HYPH|nr:LysR family transcriptional regulator [Nitratireductor pacificus]EKF17323.1 LysR family transcriptional regulator [Nitratireductor pacificus pht-3B]